MNNTIERLTKQHTFSTKRYLQKTSSSNYWIINNYRTVFCSSHWNLTCQIRNAFVNLTKNSFKT